MSDLISYVRLVLESTMNDIITGQVGPPISLAGANIVKEGWLYKRGEHIKNWRPR